MKFSKILLFFTTMMLISWLFYSCSKEDSLSSMADASIQTDPEDLGSAARRFEGNNSDSDGNIVLGDKRINPFTIANINQAKADLYGASMPDKLPTHGYFKFLPASQDDLAVLVERYW